MYENILYVSFELQINYKRKMSLMLRTNLEELQRKIAIWPLNYSSLNNKVLTQT